jgi:hypothetical protein
LEPAAFHQYEASHGGVLSRLSMVRMTPLMAERLRTYAEAKGCSSSVVIRCAVHDLLLHEGIDAYSHLPQPLPSSS